MNNNIKLKNCFVMLKPGIIKRGKVGKVLSLLEDKNLVLDKIFSYKIQSNFIDEFYKVHINKHFFSDLKKYLLNEKVIIVFLRLKNTDVDFDLLEYLNKLKGDCYSPEVGTIRFMWSSNTMENVIHVSDSLESYKYELNIIVKYLETEK